jgi:hypothetical protein
MLQTALIEQFHAPEMTMLTISVKTFLSLDGQMKISVDPILYRPYVKIYFLVEFQIISNIFLFIS